MKIAVFAGSFDPFTLAHQDIVMRALPLFEKIIIAIGINSSKQGLMAPPQRKKAIEDVFVGNTAVEVAFFEGLTVEFCRRHQAQYLLRGLRNTKDFEYENAIAQNNLLLAPQIETYLLMSRGAMAHISSTIVRDILKNKGSVNALLPQAVMRYLDTNESVL